MVRVAAVAVLLLVSTSISLLCGILTVSLIRSSKRWNGYILIVYYMSWMQMAFDISFYLLSLIYTYPSTSTWLGPAYLLTNIVGGLSAALWTCVIASITAYVVFTMKSFNIYKNWTFLCVFTTLPPLAMAIAQTVLSSHQDQSVSSLLTWAYYWTRIGCIIYNFFVCFICVIVSSSFMSSSSSTATSAGATSSPSVNSTPGTAADKQNAIRTLSQQMLLYPCAQTITRAGAAWWESKYGFRAPSLTDFASMTTEQSTAACLYAILTPAAGAAYFAVYLFMQPAALHRLKTWLRGVRVAVGSVARDEMRAELLADDGAAADDHDDDKVDEENDDDGDEFNASTGFSATSGNGFRGYRPNPRGSGTGSTSQVTINLDQD